MGIYEHFAAKGITPVQRTGVIPSATGSGHVITCTARRWVVSGQLYCFQLPPAKGRREACKPFTDPTSRITNVRINRAAAHRSKLSFGIFSALPSPSRLDVQKVRLRRLAIGRTKNLAERGGRGAFLPCLRQGGVPRLRGTQIVYPLGGEKAVARGWEMLSVFLVLIGHELLHEQVVDPCKALIACHFCCLSLFLYFFT